jgi:calcium-translocating P-type ATPase
VTGVLSVKANALTGNVLLIYDATLTNQDELIDALRRFRVPAAAVPRRPTLPPVVTESNGKERRARIAVRGLDRDSTVARKAVQMLRERGVRAWAKPLTGHVLVEYDEYKTVLRELLSLIAHVELPDLPGEDRPTHPLDRLPLWEGLLRAVGSLIGLGILTYRRLTVPGQIFAPSHSLAGTIAGLMNLVHGVPFARNYVHRHLGKEKGELLLGSLAIFSLTFANQPLGLIVTGVEALLLIGEVTARQAAWRRYEDSLEGAVAAEPGAVIRLEAGATVPHDAHVIEGTGTATSNHGLPVPLSTGALVPAGATLSGGPFVLELQDARSFECQSRPAPPRPALFDRYLQIGGWVSAAYVGFTALRTLSVLRTFEALLLMNPRTAVIARETANLATAARALRSGATLIGTRRERRLHLPNVVLIDGPRVLTEGLEIVAVSTPVALVLASEVLDVASLVSTAAGSPWGHAFPKTGRATATGGAFNGLWATACVDGVRYSLGPPEDPERIPEEFWLRHVLQGGCFSLELRNDDESISFGLIALRPKISSGTRQLIETCRRLDLQLLLLCRGASVQVKALACDAGLTIVTGNEPVEIIRRHQALGSLVALVSDCAHAAAGFAACDLAIGIGSARTGEFPVRADILAPDMRGVADLLEAGARREQGVRDGVGLSIAATAMGAALGMSSSQIGTERASVGVYLAALAAMGAVNFRSRGGYRPESSLAHLADPHPERWGRRTVAEAFHALHASADGLDSFEAASRRPSRGLPSTRDQMLMTIRNQLRTPITAVLAGGACLTLVLGQPLNTALLALTTSLNVAAGVWQEREIGKAAEELQRLSVGTARVLRNGHTVKVPTTEVVTGDVLVLGPGDRVAADARIISSAGLEVNEAALTGESLPVTKGPDEFTEIGRIVLEGSDVVVGTGRAVVFAIGRQTRLGATAAALSVDRAEHSPMGQRLSRILQIALPAAGAGGLIAGLAGVIYGGAVTAQLTVGVTTALSAIPEGLPLLAGVGQAGVANRLAARKALVRRIAAIEALGRVDVTCTDKTGTLTEGRLTLRLVANLEREARAGIRGAHWDADLRHVLLTAAIASPDLDSPDAIAHPTDIAVVRGAFEADLADEMKAPRLAQSPFDSARAFHAATIAGRLCVKGAPERLLPRCAQVRMACGDQPMNEANRAALSNRVTSFAERGLRVLLVAEGPPDTSTDDPEGLTALGFVAISDPLRPSVPEAVHRCQAAGIRVIMLTGDHPATAQSIAREAGLLVTGHDKVLRAADLAELSPAELDESLDGVAVIARAAPLDKLRIIESLRRRGHIVAMTGDGVNDAPSLRLADVGVAMGRSGTEVARQASDLVLMDDDFATLVEALVEGRGFWRNMRTALGLLLGGNMGELGLIVGTSVMGFGTPLTSVQILVVNLITDTLPSLAVVLQRPQKRDLAGLAREGLSALDSGLRRDVLRRGLATAIPSLAGFLLVRALSGPAQASSVAFTSVVATQLAQTLDAGRVQGALSRSVINAVSASIGLLVTSVTLPPVRNLLGLVTPSLLGWGVIGASSASAVLLSRAISELGGTPLGEGLQTTSLGEGLPRARRGSPDPAATRLRAQRGSLDPAATPTEGLPYQAAVGPENPGAVAERTAAVRLAIGRTGRAGASMSGK